MFWWAHRKIQNLTVVAHFRLHYCVLYTNEYVPIHIHWWWRIYLRIFQHTLRDSFLFFLFFSLCALAIHPMAALCKLFWDLALQQVCSLVLKLEFLKELGGAPLLVSQLFAQAQGGWQAIRFWHFCLHLEAGETQNMTDIQLPWAHCGIGFSLLWNGFPQSNWHNTSLPMSCMLGLAISPWRTTGVKQICGPRSLRVSEVQLCKPFSENLFDAIIS